MVFSVDETVTIECHSDRRTVPPFPSRNSPTFHRSEDIIWLRTLFQTKATKGFHLLKIPTIKVVEDHDQSGPRENRAMDRSDDLEIAHPAKISSFIGAWIFLMRHGKRRKICA